MCQFLHYSPTTSHWIAAKRVLRYLKGSITHGLRFSCGSLTLQAFCHSNWAGSHDDHRRLLVWVSILVWAILVRMVFCNIKFSLSSPLNVWCESLHAIDLTFNPIFHACTKYIEVDNHFIEWRYQTNIFKLNTYLHLISVQTSSPRALPQPIFFSLETS